ncbi:hypothetical protein ABI59_21885 [Acidobacteria bacterium Mor1]|nr:hypothetical protein ABI59_21885 [Acidobacteria bacterium Mor1]
MKRFALLITLLALCMPAMGAKLPSHTFSGSYDWSDGGSDELSAEFKSDGDDRWKVKFKFKWNGKNHTWKGSAKGSLTEDGKVIGKVDSGMGNRIWSFEADLAGNTLSGKHTEITGGKTYETGTFRISVER